MKRRTTIHATFEELSAEAIRLGRELAGAARHLKLGGASEDASLVSRCFAQLAARRPFCQELDSGLETAEKLLGCDLAREILRFEQTCVEVGYDADGPHYECEVRPVYSDRGAALRELQDLFSRFQAARSLVLDHLAAQDVVLEMIER